MNRLNNLIWSLHTTINSFIVRTFISPFKKSLCFRAGKRVLICKKCKANWNNVSIGNDVSINEGALFLCSRAKVIIGDKVMFGPNVTIITGDHRTDLVGRFMSDVTDNEKKPENDQDVIFEGDNWIGANVTILKGVKIGFGAIIGAGSLVNKDVPPFSVFCGYPARLIKYRFDNDTIKIHLEKLKKEN